MDRLNTQEVSQFISSVHVSAKFFHWGLTNVEASTHSGGGRKGNHQAPASPPSWGREHLGDNLSCKVIHR